MITIKFAELDYYSYEVLHIYDVFLDGEYVDYFKLNKETKYVETNIFEDEIRELLGVERDNYESYIECLNKYSRD